MPIPAGRALGAGASGGPAIANERLKRNQAGQVVLQLKSPYRNGSTPIVLSPLEFMQRLASAAASDSLPWHARTLRYLRAAIVAGPAQ